MNLFKTLAIVGLIIAGLCIVFSLALPSAGVSLVKGQQSRALSQYRQLYVITQSADLDALCAQEKGAFPGIATNGWSNALVTNYISADDFRTLLAVNGKISNTTIYKVTSTNDPMTVFLATANLSSMESVINHPLVCRGELWSPWEEMLS